MLFHIDGGGFTGGADHAKAVGAFGDMPVDQFAQARVVDATVFVHGGDEGNNAAGESDGGRGHVRS
ncbi:hypothetical protein D3C85_1810160 [compost metagenome]